MRSRILRLVGEERAYEEISFEFFPGSRVLVERGVPRGGLAFDVVERVLRHRVEIGPNDCDLQYRLVVEQAGLTGGARVLVAFSKCLARRLVVASERLVGVGRDAVDHDCGVEYADEAVTELDVGIKECQRFSGLHRLDPQCSSAKLHCEGVSVDPMHTVTDDIAQGVLTRRFVRGVRSGVDPRHLCGHAPRRGEKKVSRAAGGVNDAEIEDGLARVFGMTGYRIGEHRVEGRLHEFMDEGWRGVVRPGELSL